MHLHAWCLRQWWWPVGGCRPSSTAWSRTSWRACARSPAGGLGFWGAVDVGFRVLRCSVMLERHISQACQLN